MQIKITVMQFPDFQPRWRHKQIHLTSSHNQKKDKIQFKNKNNQNCHKIELYGCLTTEELKKKHSSRWVTGVDTSSWGQEDTR